MKILKLLILILILTNSFCFSKDIDNPKILKNDSDLSYKHLEDKHLYRLQQAQPFKNERFLFLIVDMQEKFTVAIEETEYEYLLNAIIKFITLVYYDIWKSIINYK